MPWVGFPLAKLLDLVEPLPTSRFLKVCATDPRPDHSRSVRAGAFNWSILCAPRCVRLTIEEARNELAFLSVGMYQAPLSVQNGAPIRMVLPWKCACLERCCSNHVCPRLYRIDGCCGSAAALPISPISSCVRSAAGTASWA